jgi:hypothetical protein
VDGQDRLLFENFNQLIKKPKKEGWMNYLTQWLENGPWMEASFFSSSFSFSIYL